MTFRELFSRIRYKGKSRRTGIEEKTGPEKKVHVQRGWEYLRKAGHTPQVPRPSNEQGADASERKAFKKVSR